MHPRSRGYSINTSSLDGSCDRFILRAAPVVYNVILGHAPRHPIQLAQFVLKKIKCFGHFLRQHAIWTFSLLGRADAITCDSWNDLKHVTARRNTLALFRRLDAGWRVKKREFRCRSESSNGNDIHVLINPFRQLERRIADKDAGEIMVKVFKMYKKYLDEFSKYEFCCKITAVDEHGMELEERNHSKTFIESELAFLKDYLTFACNCCMHERFWKD
eukprot:7634343-Pyramimonas_sp.AAC.1